MKRMMFAVFAAALLAITAAEGTAVAADAILLDFSSPHCGPCQAMRPTLDQLERAGVPVRHIDVTVEPDLAARYGIRKTPTYVVVSGGREVTRLAGTQSLAALRAAISIDGSGSLIPTGAMSSALDTIPAPQTRLAPVGRLDPAAPAFAQRQSPPTPSAATSEPMPSVSVADAVERARAATVRLRVHDGHGYGAGTGTIIDTQGAEALVLTCGHLFRETKGDGKIEVDLFIGGQVKTVLGQLLDYDADERDIALVVIQPGVPIQPVDVVGGSSRVQNGQTAFSFGCDRGDDPSRRDTRITGINKYNQHLGVSNLEIAGAPIDGRSGGGLFDASGCLIGVCNAADYKDDVGIYAGPGNIHWQLDRVGLTQLYQADPGTAIAAAEAPDQRLASLPSEAIVTGIGSSPGVSLAAPESTQLAVASGPAASANQEVIVIVRDRNNRQAASRVMTLDNPSSELLQMIQRQAR